MTKSASLYEHPLLANIGVEPLGNALSSAYLAHLFEGRKTSFKAALLDQRLVAGLGNIYVCEALWRAGLSPFMSALTLGTKSQLLVESIKSVLNEALEAGGSSLRDHRQADGSLGYFQHRFAAYDREGEPCTNVTCAQVIQRETQNGRSTFYCPHCQK